MIKKKILLCFLLFVGLFTPVTINADVSSTGKIDIIDDADFLTSVQEEELRERIKCTILTELKMDVVVLTSNTTPTNVVSYTDDYYDYNGYGKDGILFFVTDEKVYINTIGYAIIAINDEEIESILDAGWNEFLDYDYFNCLVNMVYRADDLVNIAYNNGYKDSRIDTDIKPLGTTFMSAIIPDIKSIMFSLGVTLVIMLIVFAKHNSVTTTEKASKYIDGIFDVTRKNKRYIGTRKSVSHNYYSSSSSSGGHSSGSSHTSSSGRSHGGGGRSR